MTVEDRKAIKISQWFATYGSRVLRFVKSKIKDLGEAEDIAQEVWFQLSRQDAVEEIEQIGAWLFKVANRRVINFYKKKKNIPFSVIDYSTDQAGPDRDDYIDDLSFNSWAAESLPSEIVESKEFWDQLKRILDKLPEEQRMVFIENEMNDISFRELSEKTGTSINTLLARKSYAVKKIRHEFENIFNQ